jgi:hypothetical protein
MKKISKKIIVAFLVLIFFSELISYTLGKLKIIPQGVSEHVTAIGDENIGYWHPKNIKLKHQHNTCYPPSIVYFNNIGARGKENVYLKKTKPRIALIGGEISENIQISEGSDLASLLRKKIKNFEIINFSASFMGLAEQIEVYKNLVRKYDVDYVFLFVSENDIHKSHEIDSIEKHHLEYPIRYKIMDGEVIKIPRDKEFFNIYNSFFSKVRRGKFALYLKNYSNTFKLYFHLKLNKNLKSKNRGKVLVNTPEALAYIAAHTISDNEWNRRFKENKIIYSFLIDKFLQELEQDKVKYFTFLNIKQYLFRPENNNIADHHKKRKSFFFLKEAWRDKNSFDPLKASIEYLKEKNLYKEPWLTLACTSSYSEVGNEFISTYVSDIFHKNL